MVALLETQGTYLDDRTEQSRAPIPLASDSAIIFSTHYVLHIWLDRYLVDNPKIERKFGSVHRDVFRTVDNGSVVIPIELSGRYHKAFSI